MLKIVRILFANYQFGAEITPMRKLVRQADKHDN